MPTYKLTIEYEGTRYHGWQEQKNARSVAGELKRALASAGADILELVGSGRTDAGVHALAQVAHLRLRNRLDPRLLRDRANEKLPPDIHVLAAEEASDRFHARHDALSRSYLYQICRRRTAFGKRFVWWVKRPLDLDRMREAAARFEGTHDFALFSERPAEQASTIVALEQVRIETAGALLLVRLVASHFLWKMVRRIVGTLVEVGAGSLEPGTIETLLAGGHRAGAPPFEPARHTAPPSGLFLERVSYAGDPPLGPLRPLIEIPDEEEIAPPGGPPFPRKAATSTGADR